MIVLGLGRNIYHCQRNLGSVKNEFYCLYSLQNSFQRSRYRTYDRCQSSVNHIYWTCLTPLQTHRRSVEPARQVQNTQAEMGRLRVQCLSAAIADVSGDGFSPPRFRRKTFVYCLLPGVLSWAQICTPHAVSSAKDDARNAPPWLTGWREGW